MTRLDMIGEASVRLADRLPLLHEPGSDLTDVLCATSGLLAIARAAADLSAEGCRDWPDGAPSRCGKPAVFVLWGKLWPAEAMGPRCYDCAARHVGHSSLSRDSAMLDLRPTLEALADFEESA